MRTKSIRFTELFATIRANAVAFASISMFVCLGVALFLGIQWWGRVLGMGVHNIAREGNLHDSEVKLTYACNN